MATLSSKYPSAPVQDLHILSDHELQMLLQPHSSFKDSYATIHSQSHVPLLRNFAQHQRALDVLILGNSLLDSPKGKEPFTDLITATTTLPHPKIAHLLHHLSALGLSSFISPLRPRAIILTIGTDDLHPRTGLRPPAILTYRFLLQSLLRITPSVQILVAPILPRRDVKDSATSSANNAIAALVREAADPSKAPRVHFIPLPLAFSPAQHVQANGTLTQAGLSLFSDVLSSHIRRIIDAQQRESAGAMATATTPKQGETRTIRPAQDVLARIRHDKEHFPDIGDIVIGYEDRHEGIMEVGVGQWCPVTEEEEWIPLHRIRYFRRKTGTREATVGEDTREGKDNDVEILWDRRKRIDPVFGST